MFSGLPLKENQWHHVAIVHHYHRLQSSVLKLFLDGIEVGNAKLSYPVPSTSGCTAHIGMQSSVGPSHMNVRCMFGPLILTEEILTAGQVLYMFSLSPSYSGYLQGNTDLQSPSVLHPVLESGFVTFLLRSGLRGMINVGEKDSYHRYFLSLAELSSTDFVSMYSNMELIGSGMSPEFHVRAEHPSRVSLSDCRDVCEFLSNSTFFMIDVRPLSADKITFAYSPSYTGVSQSARDDTRYVLFYFAIVFVCVVSFRVASMY